MRLTDLLAQLDPDPRIKGNQFEALTQWLFENDRALRSRFVRVLPWNCWDGRSAQTGRVVTALIGSDTGVDLVAETEEGAVHGIQCKGWAYDARLSWGQLGSFVGALRDLDGGYLVAAVGREKISRVTRSKLQHHGVHVLARDDLDTLEIDWPSGFHDLPLAPPAPRQNLAARPGQLAALDAIAAHLGERGTYVSAPGTGKTTVALSAIARLGASLTLFLTPTLHLVDQVIQRLPNIGDFRWIAVASDATLGRGVAQGVEGLLPAEADVMAEDLLIPVSTAVDQIRDWLRRPSALPRIMVATYQSLPKVVEALRLTALAFDLVIADEAHHTAGLRRPRSSAGDRGFSMILERDLVPAQRRLFMTATPRVFRIAKGSNVDPQMVASMSDEATYGPVLFTFGLREAIDAGALCDYEVHILQTTSTALAEAINANRSVMLADGTELAARDLAAKIGLWRFIQEKGVRSVVTYHNRVRSARAFANSLAHLDTEYLPTEVRPRLAVDADYISGEMSLSIRKNKISRLLSPVPSRASVIASARCLHEGVDVPALEAVVFVEPRTSDIDIVQAVGRALRISEDRKKQRGYILLPLVIDDEGESADALNSGPYGGIAGILAALRDSDPEFATELRNYQKALVYGDPPPRAKRLFIQAVGVETVRRISTRVLTLSTPFFETGFAHVEKYVATTGSARVPNGYLDPVDKFPLGSWCNSRRRDFKRGALRNEHRARLESLPGWSWAPSAEFFGTGLDHLANYVAATGSARVPDGYVDPADGFKLGQWCTNRRTDYRQGLLALPQVCRLEEMPGWTWEPFADLFGQGMSHLMKYVASIGDAAVPAKYVDPSDGFKLGGWCVGRRQHQTSLNPEQRARLESLPGWSWSPRQGMFEVGLAHLDKYVGVAGDARVPQDYRDPDDGFHLGTWCNGRRQHKASLTESQIARLNVLPGWTWTPKAVAFEAGIAHLEKYQRATGSALVPSGYLDPDDGFRLGSWCATRRGDFRKGIALRDHVARLDAVPGWSWAPKTSRFEKGFIHLKKYVALTGHSRVPKEHRDPDDGFDLGAWCAGRQAYKGTLGPDQIARLEALPGWSWTRRRDLFENGMTHLLKYVAAEGHARVSDRYVDPDDGFKLGKWTNGRRNRRTALRSDQVARLETLPGWSWSPNEDLFEAGFARLATYIARFGTAAVPLGYRDSDDGFRVGGWCAHRRQRRIGLRRDQASRLEALPGWSWTPKVDKFEAGFIQLRRFVELTGSARVPKSYVDTESGFRLGSWCATRRREYRKHVLCPARVARLEEFSGWVWDVQPD